jgi:UTP--glucose-1-phosphate uridylyltransferase
MVQVPRIVEKVVLPAAGLGTRLLPATKEQPKEMLPIFAQGPEGDSCVKPVLQAIFEQFFDAGFRHFCFVIGRGKRAIEDHFTRHSEYMAVLRSNPRKSGARLLETFYSKLRNAEIVWVNQPDPRGFGDAVLRAKAWVAPRESDDGFVVTAGDTYILSSNLSHLRRLLGAYEDLRSDAIFLVKRIRDPRQYGVVEGDPLGRGIYEVHRVVEKPKRPPSNLAIMPVYIFSPCIFDALEKVQPDTRGEIQLTNAIQSLVESRLKVHALELKSSELRLDIGSPALYWDALRLSHRHTTR